MNQPKPTATYTIIGPLEHKTRIPLNFCTNKKGSFKDENSYKVRPAIFAKSARQLKKESPQKLCYDPAKDESLFLIAAERHYT